MPDPSPIAAKYRGSVIPSKSKSRNSKRSRRKGGRK